MTSVSPEAEPDTTSEPVPETQPESEPEIPPEPEAEGESAWAEPEPDLPNAFNDWGVAWELHIYIFAACYMVMFVLAAISLTYFLKDKSSLKKGRMTFSLLIMVIIFTLFRGIAMFMDPYGTTDRIPDNFFRMLWSMALPGLTASFSVLLLVLLDTTKMSLGPPKFQKLSTILIFTAGHFAIVIISDIVFTLCNSCKGMLLFCQILFILYGVLLAVGYLYSSVVINKNCTAGTQQGYEGKKILRLSKIAAGAAAVAFTIFVTYIYTASSEFGILSKQKYVGAWKWWTLQTIIRLEEIVACCLILTIAFRNPCMEADTITGGCCSGNLRHIGNSKTMPANDTSVPRPEVTVSGIQFIPDAQKY